MTPDQLMLAVLGPVVLAGAVAVVVLVWLVHRDPGLPATAGWAPAELTALGVGLRRVPCPVCPSRHCAGCAEPARHMAAPHSHQGAHRLADTPPSIAPVLALMDPASRARELVRQLGQADWWPWLDLPAGDKVSRHVRLRLRGWAIAQRHGLPNLLGTFQLQGVLPS
jgi:hypothetical protein